MFTGIVEETGEVLSVEADEDGRRVRIGADEVAGDLQHGQSVAVSGACLTVEEFGAADGEPAGWFEVFLAAETVERTYLGELTAGDPVNLERAVPVDGRLDGHVVQGHVDATTEVLDVREVGEDWTFEFAVPPGYGRYLAEKGFVALDGISLTVAERFEDSFTVAVIPTTYRLTTLGAKAPGDLVNVEIDPLARYAERLLDDRDRAAVPLAGEDAAGASSGRS